MSSTRALAMLVVIAPASVRVESKSVTGVVVELEAMATIKGHVTRGRKPVTDADVCCVQRTE